MQKIKNLKIWLVVIVLVLFNLLVVLPRVSASALTKAAIQEVGGASFASPMAVSAGQQLAVDFKTVASGATSATINFNNFSGGTVNATQSVTSTGCTTYFPSATVLPGTLTAAGSGNIITISAITSLAATTEYCVLLTSVTAVTNPSGAGVYSALVTVGSDSQTAAFDVLTANSNSISITGTVAPTFTMALSGCNSGPPSCTDTFASNLSATALTVSNGVTVTASTNGKSGYNLYALDTNAGLTSASAGHTIATVSTGSNHTMNGGTIGTEAYALGVSANNTTNYAYGAGTTGGGLSSSAYNEIATYATPVANQTQVLHELADISGTTPPGSDYTDTVTVIGTGAF